MSEILEQFLAMTAKIEDTYLLSSARAYQHEESDYDRQYGLEDFALHELVTEAGHIIDLCRRHGLPDDAAVLEIGCGTGRISIGLAHQPSLLRLLITDPSPSFCRIVRQKLAIQSPTVPHIDYGVLRAEDVASLPQGSVSLILLRSVLHHITDVDGFLKGCASVLPPGGLLVCEEPYYDGYLMMGFLAQFIEPAFAASGYTCSAEEHERIQYFIASMQFYSRRDVDKSLAEDKHLFRPDELMAIGREMGLSLTHYPNWRMTISEEANLRSRQGFFFRFFADYIFYCMDWPKEFAREAATVMKPYFQYFEPIESGENSAPYCFGTFVFTKR